jgi:adenylate cyclase
LKGARLTPRLGGLIAALVMAALLQLAGPTRISQPVYDLWQRLAPRDLSKTPVRIVWIDDGSLKKLGTWPWSRYTMARLTETIAAAGPKVIGFDMLFPEVDRAAPAGFADLYPELNPATKAKIRALPSMDTVFGGVIGQHPVVLGRAGIDAPPMKKPPVLAVEAQFATPLPDSVAGWGQALHNIAEIDDVALGHGLINGERDGDGIVRRVPLVGRVAGTDTPGFALELARIAMGQDVITPEGDKGNLSAIQLGKTRLPVDARGRMAFRLGATPKGGEISALDILDGTTGKAALKDKIVIVGLSGAGTADLVSTPLSAGIYGSAVQANAVDAILSGATLERPRWAWLAEFLATILLVAVAVRMLPRMRPVQSTLLGGGIIVALLAASLFAFTQAGLLVDPASPLLTGGATAIAMLLMLFGESRRQRAQLTASLQEERVTTARAAGELAAAHDIQIGMLPPRESLARFDPSVALDALIEPARSVGGDFYDAIRLDDRHVCFLVGDVTGKGVPAALFMALSKALTKSVLLRDGLDLAAAVTRLNDEVARDNPEAMFVTMIFALLDTQTGSVSLCNAGHENPWLVRADGSITHLAPDGGPPLSVAPGFPYSVESVALGAGDAIVFVSDGITEAQNGAGAFFGDGRLEAVLKEAASHTEIADMGNALLRDVRLFENGAEATDDLTVLAFRYQPAVT